jgi:hypothetical protein
MIEPVIVHQVPAQPDLPRIPKGELMHAPRISAPWTTAVVLYTDQTWHPAEVMAWCRYRSGWAVLIRWPDGSQDWREHDSLRLFQE